MDQYKYSWCEPRALDRHLQGDWYHVTDAVGETVAWVIRRGPHDWVALLDDEGGEFAADSRVKALRKARGLE
jgi:hypothetical protein